MKKPYVVEFNLNAKLLTIIYICYKYKFPLQFMLTFYEMYGDTSMFALKALTCTKKTPLNDNELIKIIDESRKLYHQIQKGISLNIKIDRLKKENAEDIPEPPQFDLRYFSQDYINFVNDYLLKNVDDIYGIPIRLHMNSEDIYSELS